MSQDTHTGILLGAGVNFRGNSVKMTEVFPFVIRPSKTGRIMSCPPSVCQGVVEWCDGPG